MVYFYIILVFQFICVRLGRIDSESLRIGGWLLNASLVSVWIEASWLSVARLGRPRHSRLDFCIAALGLLFSVGGVAAVALCALKFQDPELIYLQMFGIFVGSILCAIYNGCLEALKSKMWTRFRSTFDYDGPVFIWLRRRLRTPTQPSNVFPPSAHSSSQTPSGSAPAPSVVTLLCQNYESLDASSRASAPLSLPPPL
ncbi:hypothetical protein OROMI_031257 [Orobanche minor]